MQDTTGILSLFGEGRKEQKCTNCGVMLPMSEYYPRTRNGKTIPHRTCRFCMNSRRVPKLRACDKILEGILRKCARCEKYFPTDSFPRRQDRTGRSASFCRACRRAYDRDYWRDTKHRGGLVQRRKNHKLRTDRNFEVVYRYLLTHPCVDCGEKDTVVLEFDHRDPTTKHKNVSQLISESSISKLKKEIEKCDVMCANCHRRKTAKQFGFRRVMMMQQSSS